MRNIAILFAFLFFSHHASAQAEKIKGVWLTEDGKAKVEISEGQGFYYGKIIWLREPNDEKTGKPKLDTYNPDPQKQQQPLLYSILIWGYKFENNAYVGGNVYDPRDGKVYDGKLWLEGPNSLRMRGYWGIFFKTETWTRVS
jgi:uncharacterized protein (DUF2147 family)